MESKETKLAVLIDAENVPPTKIKSMLNELTRYSSESTVIGQRHKSEDGNRLFLNMQSFRCSSINIPPAKTLLTLQ